MKFLPFIFKNGSWFYLLKKAKMLKGPQHDSDDRETKTHSVCALHSSSGEAPFTGPAL